MEKRERGGGGKPAPGAALLSVSASVLSASTLYLLSPCPALAHSPSTRAGHRADRCAQSMCFIRRDNDLCPGHHPYLTPSEVFVLVIMSTTPITDFYKGNAADMVVIDGPFFYWLLADWCFEGLHRSLALELDKSQVCLPKADFIQTCDLFFFIYSGISESMIYDYESSRIQMVFIDKSSTEN